MSTEQTSDKKKNLSDIASESFILILQLRATTEYGNASDLKTRVIDMFDKFENNARRIGIDNEKVLSQNLHWLHFLMKQ